MHADNTSVNSQFENYELLRRQFAFWLMWMLANVIGIAFGWAIGETFGQAIGRSSGWALGVRVAWMIFEVVLWLARGAVLLYVREFSAWRSVDTIVWVCAEFFGEILGEGMLEVNGPVWLTSGAVWGAILGAGLWLALWLVIQPKRTMKWHPLLAAMWALIGLVGGSLLFALGIVVGQEVGDFVGKVIHPIVGWGVSGAVIGCLIGSITGLAFVRLLNWQSLPVDRA